MSHNLTSHGPYFDQKIGLMEPRQALPSSVPLATASSLSRRSKFASGKKKLALLTFILLASTKFAITAISANSAPHSEDSILFYDVGVPDYETVLTPADFEMALEINDYPQHRGGKKGESEDNQWDSEAMYNPDKFEGDIANELNASSVELFVRGAPEDLEQEVQYNAIRDRRQLWRDAKIPYAISSQYSSYSRSVIASAMQEYSKHTCVQWVPRSVADRDYVYIMPERGCYSMVGKTGGRQTLSLGNGCIQKGIIIHEMMHAVGFFHEQSRTDRDSFITIMWHNILPGMQGQFEKYTTATVQTLGVDYDYASIMHYGPSAFTRNGLPTIVPKRQGASIGQRTGFSKLDSYKINTLYDCPTYGGQTGTTPTPLATTSVATVNPFVPPNPRPIVPLVVPYVSPPTLPPTSTFPSPLITTATGGSYVVSTTLPPLPHRPDVVSIIAPAEGGNARGCRNTRPDCDQLARQGWCSRNPGWMREHCPISCGFCPTIGSSSEKKPETITIAGGGGGSTSGSCEDLRVDCAELAKKRYCLTAQNFAKTYCARSCGFCFVPPVTEMPDYKGIGVTEKPPQSATKAGPTLVTKMPMVTFWPKPSRAGVTRPPTAMAARPCRDRKHFCVAWKKAGFCKGIFLSYMKKNCPAACGWC